MDIKDTTRTVTFRAVMVSPANIDDELGELKNVNWSASTITAGYYTDSRTAGTLSIKGDGNDWVRGSFIRVYARIEEWGVDSEVGTYAVSNDDSTRRCGAWETELELVSMLHTMSLDIAPTPKTLGINASVKKAIASEVSAAGRQCVLDGIADSRISTPLIQESGQSRLSRIYELARTGSKNRIDVDPHGRIVAEKYISPANKTPKMTILLDDPRGISKDGVQRTSDWLSIPSVAAVSYKYTDDENGETVEREITAQASSPENIATSAKNRGYTITKFRQLTSLPENSVAAAITEAQSLLSSSTAEKTEWTMTIKYVPSLWEGDVVIVSVPDGSYDYRGERKCLVKSVDINLQYGDMTITLKETASGDDE